MNYFEHNEGQRQRVPSDFIEFVVAPIIDKDGIVVIEHVLPEHDADALDS